MPRVYNRHRGDAPPNAVYIGRGTIYGNPFSHIDYPNTILVGSRDEAVEKYRERLENMPSLQKLIKKELKGKDLVCSCAPRACHGDVILEIANED